MIESALITGGSGFLGSAIVRILTKKHPTCKVTIADIQKPSDNLLKHGHVEYLATSTTSPSDLQKAFETARPQVVIHSAGLIPSLSERYGRRVEKIVFQVNVEGTRNVLKAAQEAGCAAFVYTSSCCAVMDDMTIPYANIDERWPVSEKSSVYGESKMHAERLLLAADHRDMPICVLRPSVVFGPGDRQLIPPIHACIAKNELPYIVGDGLNLWDVTFVDNIADAHILAAENLLSSKTAAGEVFFIQNNEPVTFREFSLEIWKNFGHFPSWQIHIPESIAWIMGFGAEWVTYFTGSPTTLSRGSVQDACCMRYASGDKARRLLGYVPKIGIEEGIRLSCLDYAQRLRAKETQASTQNGVNGLLR